VEGISFDQIRQFSNTAGMPVLPVARIVRETVEATVEAWRGLEAKELLPAAMSAGIGRQIEGVAGRGSLR
jgi:histone H3/H4